MKNGLLIENGVPTYYENDVPVHKGIVRKGEDIYYIGKGGKAITGEKFVHTSMTNDIVKHGTYTFGRDYKMKKGSYRPAGKKHSLHSRIKRFFKPSSHRSSKQNEKHRTAMIVTPIVLILLLAGMITFIAISENSPVKTDPGASAETRSDEMLYVKIPEIEDEVWLVTDEAKTYYTGGAEITTLLRSNPYRAFRFNYSIVCLDNENQDQLRATLFLSENASMENAAAYEADPWAEYLSVDNLKVDTVYYYRFEVSLADETHTLDGSFKTAATHRFLYLPDVKNIRDVGGRKTMDGKAIKQNMIIRGSEIDGLGGNSYYLLDNYIDYARELFGFKSDLDLRHKSVGYTNYASRLGDDVYHSYFNSPGYAGVLSEDNQEAVRAIFSFLADSANYPIYLHCTYGVDRTGTIVYLLDALLGLSEDEMITEYQLSYTEAENLEPLRNALDSYEGETINEKVENFLVESIGVTPEEIASIRSIMLSD